MTLLLLYLFIACGYFSILILLIVKDRESSFKNPIHLQIALLASLLWPIVIPLSLLELRLKANKAKQETVFSKFKLLSIIQNKLKYFKSSKQIEATKNETTSSDLNL